jgi:hypothetical protein
MGTLPAYRQPFPMSQPSIAAKIHKPLDIHRHFAPQITLNFVLTVYDFPDFGYILISNGICFGIDVDSRLL